MYELNDENYRESIARGWRKQCLSANGSIK